MLPHNYKKNNSNNQNIHPKIKSHRPLHVHRPLSSAFSMEKALHKISMAAKIHYPLYFQPNENHYGGWGGGGSSRNLTIISRTSLESLVHCSPRPRLLEPRRPTYPALAAVTSAETWSGCHRSRGSDADSLDAVAKGSTDAGLGCISTGTSPVAARRRWKRRGLATSWGLSESGCGRSWRSPMAMSAAAARCPRHPLSAPHPPLYRWWKQRDLGTS